MVMMNVQDTSIAHFTAEMREEAMEMVEDTTGLAMEIIVKKIEVMQEKEKNSASSKDLA